MQNIIHSDKVWMHMGPPMLVQTLKYNILGKTFLKNKVGPYSDDVLIVMIHTALKICN